MKIDSTLPADILKTKVAAQAGEDAGYDGLWVGETQHEPFMQLLQAAEATERVTVGTSVAIAFARSPMTLANAAFDLARYSGGRFVLGLGSQIKPHVEKRFSMPWSHPAPRMRELILALRAIWDCWQNGTKLAFQGDFYTHTLMTPFFSPSPHEWGAPPVYLAGVGKMMTEVAGEAADGFFVHPLTTERYLTEVTVPALQRGRERAGRAGTGLDGFVLCGPVFTCVGRTEEELATAVAGTKEQIAFYASTPGYRGVLELHGWGDLQLELNALSKQGRWSDMGSLIDDDMLHAFAVVGDPQEAAKGLRERYGAVIDRISLYTAYKADKALISEVVAALRD